jgi:cellulose synthase/poly-beta-1,6-N-acetylglucosamine synthase-like glycosyltransferase
MALYVIIAVNVLYLSIFSVASLWKKPAAPDSFPAVLRRIVILVPAYGEDRVIMECTEACLKQNYPQDKYDVAVISDHMADETNEMLSRLPVRLFIARFESSTKTKALNLALDSLSGYDAALILDADNVIAPDFLHQINYAFDEGKYRVFQAHRIAKNKNTDMAVLDAVSEEINNSIFRLGHVNLGFSAALIGSGMAFEFNLLKDKLSNMDAVGGFDRALELRLFNDGIRIGYLQDAYVLDEKVQNNDDFYRQRRRWMSAQIHYLKESFPRLPDAFKAGKGDYCDKMFQQMILPRIFLIGFTALITLTVTFVSPPLAVKWGLLLILLGITLLLAVPRQLYDRRLLKALSKLPAGFFYMFLNLCRLKGANRKFIHTKHGIQN